MRLSSRLRQLFVSPTAKGMYFIFKRLILFYSKIAPGNNLSLFLRLLRIIYDALISRSSLSDKSILFTKNWSILARNTLGLCMVTSLSSWKPTDVERVEVLGSGFFDDLLFIYSKMFWVFMVHQNLCVLGENDNCLYFVS